MSRGNGHSNRYILRGGNIVTMDDKIPRASSLAVLDGKIYGVGWDTDFPDLTRDGWQVRDLNGLCVLPGFIDTHCHMDITGLIAAGVDTRVANNMQDLRHALADAAKTTADGDWVSGWYFNEMEIEEQRVPTRHDLDLATTRHPVVVTHVTTHHAFLNSAALTALGIKKGDPGADLEDGELTGVVRDPCSGRALSKIFHEISDETRADAYRRAAQAALKGGFTTLHTNQGGDDSNLSALVMEIKDQLPVHLVIWNASFNLTQVAKLGLNRVGGCGDTQADGAIMAHTAALFEPYADEPENTGLLRHSQETWDNFVSEAHGKGLQFCAHTIGDRAIEQILTAIERALAKEPKKDHRHRIDHCILPTDDQIQRMAKAGVMAAVQPSFLGPDVSGPNLSKAIRFLGADRVMRQYHPYRKMLDAGVRLCAGTDSPVVPFDALDGIYWAVNHPNADQRVSVQEALDMWTRTAAWSGFEEDIKGSLVKGKHADMVVLTANPFRVAPERIRDLQVVQTIVNGRIAYSAATPQREG